MFDKKVKVKQESKTAAALKELYKELDALVVKFAATDASLENFIEADTPLQYELRHAVMLAVVTKRLQLNNAQAIASATGRDVQRDGALLRWKPTVETR
jgi:hypothetical protein